MDGEEGLRQLARARFMGLQGEATKGGIGRRGMEATASEHLQMRAGRPEQGHGKFLDSVLHDR